MTEHLPVIPGPLAVLLILGLGCIAIALFMAAMVIGSAILDRHANTRIDADSQRHRDDTTGGAR